MHHSEWLDDAKRVPVGQHRRVYHGAERRPNLVVWNNEDSWSCYCHACHTGGKVYKQVLQRPAVSAPVYRKYLNESDCCTLPYLARTHREKYKRLVLLLHKKHMSTALLAKYKPLYNLVDDRVVFRFNGVSIGRDVTERSHAKWLKYYDDEPMEFVYLRGENTQQLREPVILTEDLFSAMKVTHYTGHSSLCCLGTRIHDSIVSFITADRFYPILAFDGDEAGDAAKRAASKRLSLRGVEYSAVRVPDGLDPKDLNHRELLELFDFIGESYGHSSHTS